MSGALGAGDLVHLGAVAEAAARAGGRVVAEHFGRLAAGVHSKAPGDYVSEVDLRSEETVREALAKDAPEIAFFGEEGGGSRGDLWWVVDPLDGTANFLHGFPIVGVSVALVEAGRPVAGAVHAPMLGETYTAVRGGGAFRDGRPVRVAQRPPASAICNTGFPFKRKHRLDDYRRVFEGAFLALEDLRRAGAASLDLAWTAAGVFDGFFEIGLGSWDVAAGALLVTEAAGVVTDWAGDDQAWLTSGDILAAPAPVHRILLELATNAG
ncbi:MAG TPA: inositol monophosphatase family protein [Acidimicrobiia bacterium]|nr:inositol monophosphatase family protein [Acidimicrobiia bacterium]